MENNTGLDAAESHTLDVANYLRNFPIQTLAAARDLTKISNAMDNIFTHLPKIRQSRYYDLERCAKLLEATTLTLRQRIEVTLRNNYKSNGIILRLPFEQFQKEVHFPTQDIFVRFDDQHSQFTHFLTELGRRRRVSTGDASKTIKQIIDATTLYHQVLRERLEAIHHFRAQHQKLRAVVTEVLTGEQEHSNSTNNTTTGEEASIARSAVREVDDAPIALFAAVDVLDLTAKGTAAFDAALENYDRKIDAIEERLAKLLRDKLTQCQVMETHFYYLSINHIQYARYLQNSHSKFISSFLKLQNMILFRMLR